VDGPVVGTSLSPQTTVGAPAAAELAIRAHYIADVAILVEHLHPSALSDGSAGTVARLGRAASAPALAWPVAGPITQPFGVPELGVGTPHTGIDIAVGLGTPVRAAAAGVVSFAGGDPRSGYGYYVILDHGAGVSTLYAHLALPPFLRTGQFLGQDALLGLSGSTGFSTGPHVHFEVRLNGTPTDPQRLLPVLRTLPATTTHR
jgi:murein DD-endopeptidase MepM/ murein hydrolase activator NlpD